jgi:hypothetical protein
MSKKFKVQRNKFKTPWKTDLNEKKMKKRKSKKRKSENPKSHCKIGCEPTTFKSKDRKENEEKKSKKLLKTKKMSTQMVCSFKGLTYI